jgi:glycosyltransferase involved in cell wall biosynthesis
MKILIVHDFYQQPGGEDAVVREEAELLKRHGQDVSLFTTHNDEIDGFWPKLRTALTVAYNPQARRKLTARLKVDRPDIVHVHNFFPLLSPSIFYACRDLDIPCVFTLHNFRILCPTCFLYFDAKIRERSLHHPCWWTIPRRVYRNSYFGTLAVAVMVELHKRIGTWTRSVDRFIALTPYAKSKFVEGGLPADRIVIKANAIEEPIGSEATLPRHGALYVGRLSEEKGLRTLLEAWKNIDYPLKVVGAGPMKKLIEATAEGDVKCVGYLSRDDVQVEMRKASFLILPSLWYEMFGVVAVEAFACGLPVISSSLASLEEINLNGVTGLSFRTGDVDDLAEKVRWATLHPTEMEQYGRNGHKRYEELYSPDRNYRALMKIYQDAMSSRKAVAR